MATSERRTSRIQRWSSRRLKQEVRGSCRVPADPSRGELAGRHGMLSPAGPSAASIYPAASRPERDVMAISRRNRLRAALVVAIYAAVADSGLAAEADGPGNRPNILWI